MKILFFYCACSYPVGYSQGIGYLSALLKQKGHQSSCLLLTRLDAGKITDRIDVFRPDIIGISLTTDGFELARASSEFINDRYKLPIIMGGPHPTVSPQECLDVMGVFGICRGEGEFALLELISALEENRKYTSIKNFWFKEGGRVIKNSPRPKVENLDILPFPDRETQQGFIDYSCLAEFMVSRGCPFKCSYCINHFLCEFYKGLNKTFISYRSVDNVLREISEFVKRYHPEAIVFHDDTFALNIKWLKEFSCQYPKYFDLPVMINTHPALITKEIAELLKKSRVFKVKIGLETGSERLREKLLKRNIPDSSIINSARLLQDQDIEVITFNMIGLPTETSKNIEETISLNKKMMPLSNVGLSMFKPYPGTEIYDYCKSEGLFSDRTTVSYFDDRSVLNQKCIDQRTLSYYWKIFRPSIFGSGGLLLIKLAARYPALDKFYAIYKKATGRAWRILMKNFNHILRAIISCPPALKLILYISKKSILFAPWKKPPKEALRLLFYLEDILDAKINEAAIAYEGGEVHPKHRLMSGYHDFFVERIKPEDTVLDVGCGNGAVANSIAKKISCRVVGIDSNEESIKTAKRLWSHPKLYFMAGTAPADIPEEAFSVVVLSNVIEHIKNRVYFLNEIKNKVNPREILVRAPFYQRGWKVPFKKELGIPYFNDPGHYIEYTEETMEEELEKAGYVITEKIIRWGEIWVMAFPKGI